MQRKFKSRQSAIDFICSGKVDVNLKPTWMSDNNWRIKHSRLKHGKLSKMQQDVLFRQRGIHLESETFILKDN